MPEEYTKKFDSWNDKKKSVDATDILPDFFYHEREVWWCSVGVNVGREMDGKNEYFERPVLVVRRMNREQFLGAPLTSRNKSGRYYVSVRYGEDMHEGTVCLSQFKTFSAKRLLRKIGMMERADFLEVKQRFINFFSFEEYINKSDPGTSPGSSEAEAISITSVENSPSDVNDKNVENE